jgi:hypothetical protein
MLTKAISIVCCVVPSLYACLFRVRIWTEPLEKTFTPTPCQVYASLSAPHSASSSFGSSHLPHDFTHSQSQSFKGKMILSIRFFRVFCSRRLLARTIRFLSYGPSFFISNGSPFVCVCVVALGNRVTIIVCVWWRQTTAASWTTITTLKAVLSLALRLGRVGRRQVGGLQLAAICREVFQLKNASGLLCFPYTPNAIITNVSHKKNMKNRKKNDIWLTTTVKWLTPKYVEALKEEWGRGRRRHLLRGGRDEAAAPFLKKFHWRYFDFGGEDVFKVISSRIYAHTHTVSSLGLAATELN